jgi:hypothetical protein
MSWNVQGVKKHAGSIEITKIMIRKKSGKLPENRRSNWRRSSGSLLALLVGKRRKWELVSVVSP